MLELKQVVSKVEEEEDDDGCPICFEEIEEDAIAMRCSGKHGQHHYFHSQCLEDWIRSQQERRANETCPICRGSLEYHHCTISSDTEDENCVEIDDEYQNWDDIETDDSDSEASIHEFYDEVDWLDCIRERTVTSQEINAAYRLSPDGTGRFVTEYEFMNFCVHTMGLSWTNAGVL